MDEKIKFKCLEIELEETLSVIEKNFFSSLIIKQKTVHTLFRLKRKRNK